MLLTTVVKIFFIFVMVAGLFSIPFGLPGTFIILGAAFLYALWTKYAVINVAILIILLCASLLAEGVEAAASLLGSRKYGSSRAGMFAAVIGGIIGAIIGAPILLGLGAFIGALAGAFLAALMMELLQGKPAGRSMRAGWGSLLGRLTGTGLKMIIGSAMVILCLVRIF